MDESGPEKPKPPLVRNNVFSVRDRIEKNAQQRREQEQAKIAASVRAEGFAVYSDWDNPDRVRRKSVVIKAGEMLDELKAGPALSPEAIAEARKQLPEDFSAISYLITHFTHQQLIEEPNRFWAILDMYFGILDKLAETVVDQESAERDIRSRFARELTPDEWVRATAAEMDFAQTDFLSGKKPSFQELFPHMTESVGLKSTTNIVRLLDEYTHNDRRGPSAPYLLALVLEYKKRRKLPWK
ncbi:MAG: hypothetical protein Q7S08_00405 [bacterium]|nr:hypothetical protein [bacterium]